MRLKKSKRLLLYLFTRYQIYFRLKIIKKYSFSNFWKIEKKNRKHLDRKLGLGLFECLLE